MSIDIKANELARAIIESTEFKDFKQARLIIDKTPSYKNSIKSLQDKQSALQSNLAYGNQANNEALKSIKDYYNKLAENDDIKKYLFAEKKFNSLVANTFKTINSQIQNNLK